MAELENRYIVFRIKDAEAANLSADETIQLSAILDKIRLSQIAKTGKQIEACVIESTWPEYNQVVSMLLIRLEQEENRAKIAALRELDRIVSDFVTSQKPKTHADIAAAKMQLSGGIEFLLSCLNQPVSKSTRFEAVTNFDFTDMAWRNLTLKQIFIATDSIKWAIAMSPTIFLKE